MPSINLALISFIHQGAGFYPILDRVLIVLTTTVTFLVLTGIFLFLFIRPFTTSDPRARLERIGTAIEVSVSFFCTWFVVAAIKVLVALPRPFVSFDHIEPLVAAAPFESFPSAHAALTMAVAIAVMPFRRHVGHMLIAFSLVIALSRLFVGVHYPFDVGIGLLLGYVIPKGIHRLFQRKGKFHA